MESTTHRPHVLGALYHPDRRSCHRPLLGVFYLGIYASLRLRPDRTTDVLHRVRHHCGFRHPVYPDALDPFRRVRVISDQYAVSLFDDDPGQPLGSDDQRRRAVGTYRGNHFPALGVGETESDHRRGGSACAYPYGGR